MKGSKHLALTLGATGLRVSGAGTLPTSPAQATKRRERAPMICRKLPKTL